MTQAYVGQKRIRRYYGNIREVLEMPNLIEVQKASYDLFLNSGEGEGHKDGEGIQGVFQSVFPIKDFNETATLEFVKYELEKPKYDVDECRQRGITFAAPLKVTLRLVVWDVDEETGAKVALVGQAPFAAYERSMLLGTIDSHWREHLAALGVTEPAQVRLVGTDLETIKAARPEAGYLVEWDIPAEIDMDTYLTRKKEKSPKYAEIPEVSFLRTYVREDTDKCLCFYNAPDEDAVVRARAAVDTPFDRMFKLEV